jgi:hypothetical protein
MIISIDETIPVICSALGRGQRIRLTVGGGSMTPFIRDGDVCEVSPPSTLALGHIVLAKSRSRKYCLHRIVKIVGDHFFLRGDAQDALEGPFATSDILGRVSMSYRKGHARALDRGLWRIAGLLWIATAPFGTRLLHMAIRTRQIARKLAGAC